MSKRTWRIFHNPHCSKSRTTLEILRSKGIEPEVVDYQKNPPTRELLTEISQKLGLPPRDFIRTKDDTFKTLGIDLSDNDQVFSALENNPGLLERPIVLTQNGGAIGRPPESVLALFSPKDESAH